MDDLELTFDIRPRWNSYIEFYGDGERRRSDPGEYVAVNMSCRRPLARKGEDLVYYSQQREKHVEKRHENFER